MGPGARPRPRGARSTTGLLVALLPAVFTAHRFANGFVFDDAFVITRGDVIHDWSRLPEVLTSHTMVVSAADVGAERMPVDTYRPLTLLTFFADASLSGRTPWAYHLTNLAAHCLTTFLVFVVARALLRPALRGYAALAAAFFGLSPWIAEAHVWINGRSDVFCTLFALLALLAAARSVKEEGARRIALEAAAGAALLAGLLSKEVLLPCLALVPLVPVPGAPLRLRERFRLAVAAALAGAVYLAVRIAVLGGMRASRSPDAMVDALRNLPILLVDAPLALLVPRDPHLRSLVDEYAALGTAGALAATAAVLALAVALYAARRRFPVVAFGAGSAGLALAPVAVVSTMLWPGFGRYLYLPCALLAPGLAELVGAAAERFPSRRRLLALASGAYVLALGLSLAAFTLDFRSDEALYAHAIEAAPGLAFGYGFLGLARAHGDCAGAVEPLARAAAMAPGESRYLARLGRCYLELGDRARAQAVAEEGIRRFRGRPEVAGYHLLAVNSLPARDPEAAVGHLVACMRATPDRVDCRDALRFLVDAAPDRADNRAALERLER